MIKEMNNFHLLGDMMQKIGRELSSTLGSL